MQHAIRFETYAPPQPPDPARMDVACLVGFAALRAGATVPGPLAAELAQAFGQPAADFALPGGLYNRPVPITSVGEFEALFDDARLERRVQIDGGPLAEALPGSGVDDVLTIVIDGRLHDVPLTPLPTTPDAAAVRIDAAGLGIEVSVQTTPSGRILRLALPISGGPGTLAVLPYPTLGFPQTRRASARAVPSALGMAVRQVFAMGGRKVIVVSMGPAPIYDGLRAERLAALQSLFAEVSGTPGVGDVITGLSRPALSPASEPQARRGITQLYGLTDATFLLLPDLPELCAPLAALAADRMALTTPTEVFADCLPPDATASDAAQSPYLAPELDDTGHALWQAALSHTLGMLRAHARDTLLIAALPRAARALAQIAPPRSAFLQLAEGWVRANASTASPQGLMSPDAVLAGHLARRALVGGTFLSAAALPLAPLRDIERRAATVTAPTCRLHADLHGIRLTGDLTTSDTPEWADGPVSRIMAMLLRQARQLGQEIAFEPNAEALWARIRDVLGGLLTAMWRAGALAGDTLTDAFTVRCDRSTMSPQEIDTGVLVAEVTFTPNVAVQAITLRLPLTERPAAAAQPMGGPA